VSWYFYLRRFLLQVILLSFEGQVTLWSFLVQVILSGFWLQATSSSFWLQATLSSFVQRMAVVGLVKISALQVLKAAAHTSVLVLLSAVQNPVVGMEAELALGGLDLEWDDSIYQPKVLVEQNGEPVYSVVQLADSE
jgi:hypothetical protein